MKNKKGTKNVNWKNSQMYAWIDIFIFIHNDHQCVHLKQQQQQPQES